MENTPLLTIRDLNVSFRKTRNKYNKAVDGVNLEIEKGSILGLVGESGSGKSVTSLSVMQLIERNKNTRISGNILFNGQDLMQKSEKEMQKIRGDSISMIFQEPSASINPVFTIGHQISESIMLHKGKTKSEARELATELLRQVGIPSPSERYDCYPHQMSGGMLQRVMIAMALACDLELLIADEPTTALDVTIQSQILRLMKELQAEKNMTILLITHDMGVVAEMADFVAVMYLGQIVEKAPVKELFAHPLHPYTNGLLRCIPTIGRHEKLYSIPMAKKVDFGGCKFCNRCEKAMDICKKLQPPVFKITGDHEVKCWIYQNQKEGEGVVKA